MWSRYGRRITMENPQKTEEFIDFLNDVNELATEKYGWNVSGHNFETNELFEVIFTPAIGTDAQNRKF